MPNTFFLKRLYCIHCIAEDEFYFKTSSSVDTSFVSSNWISMLVIPLVSDVYLMLLQSKDRIYEKERNIAFYMCLSLNRTQKNHTAQNVI